MIGVDAQKVIIKEHANGCIVFAPGYFTLRQLWWTCEMDPDTQVSFLGKQMALVVD